MSDEEIDTLLKELEHNKTPTSSRAIRCIKELKARRDELQNSIDSIANG